jgi:valyl-tRNA synthetase
MTKHFGEEVSMSFDYHSIAQDLDDYQQALNPYDTWMLGKLHDKFAQVQKYIEKYMLGEALQEVIDMTR